MEDRPPSRVRESWGHSALASGCHSLAFSARFLLPFPKIPEHSKMISFRSATAGWATSSRRWRTSSDEGARLATGDGLPSPECSSMSSPNLRMRAVACPVGIDRIRMTDAQLRCQDSQRGVSRGVAAGSHLAPRRLVHRGEGLRLRTPSFLPSLNVDPFSKKIYLFLHFLISNARMGSSCGRLCC